MAKSATKETPASAFPLFYSKPIPLDSKLHAGLSLKKDFGFGFAEKANAVPINLIEFPQVCHFYPIAFSPDENATPVALMGLRDDENLFVSKKGAWENDTYIPAYVRRYPFIFSEVPGRDQLSLCLDYSENVIEKGGNQLFFTDKGEASALSKNALEFCKSYHAAAQHTLEFGQALVKSGILVDRQAEVTLADGRRLGFSGFRIVDEQKFAALDATTFLEWRSKNWLAYIYAHLFSGAQWQRLTQMINKRMEKQLAK